LCILHAQVESAEKEVTNLQLPPFLEMDRQLQGEEDEKKVWGIRTFLDELGWRWGLNQKKGGAARYEQGFPN
jgi:hypothetical protein